MKPLTPEDDREIEYSALGGRVSRDGTTVEVFKYRFKGTADQWTLEVVDAEEGHTVFENLFETDLEAYEAFERVVAEEGIRSFVEADPDDGSQHVRH